MKVITLSEVASRLRQRRQGRGYLAKFINECAIEDAIPLDRIKQAREEIDQAYEDFDGYDPYALCGYSSRVDEILDRLIAESEKK